MAKKTFNEKLHHAGDLPKVEEVTDPKAIARFGGVKMAIAPPLDYDEIMRRIPKGQLTTVADIRKALAQKYHADYTCQLTAGIFVNIAANAAHERQNQGSKDITPYWRTLKKDGELNEKYPDGIEGQKALLEAEGHEVIQKGKRSFVKNYAAKMAELS